MGAIRALAPDAGTVRIRPREKTGECGLDVRVFAGQTDLGAAWRTIDEGGDAALSVTLAKIGERETVNAAWWSSTASTPWSGHVAPPG